MKRTVVLALFGFTNICSADLLWEKPAQEFQRRPEEKELVVEYAFRNAGSAPVTITKVSPSCGCTTADLPKKTYAPGESGRLTAKFTFGGRRGLQAKSIGVTTDDRKTAQLTFRCLILDDPVSISPSLVWWRVGEEAKAKEVQIVVSESSRVHITQVASTNPHFSAVLRPEPVGDKYAVSITPLDTARTEKATVFLQSDSPPEGPKAYAIQVHIK